MQGDAADDLHMIVFEFEYAPRRFPDDGESVVKDVVKRFPLGKPVFEHVRLLTQIGVAHRGVFRFELFDAAGHFIQLFQASPAVAVEHVIDQSHNEYLSIMRGI